MYDIEFILIIISIIFPIILIKLIFKTTNLHLNYSKDVMVGVQKIHSGNVPRVGGLVIFLTMILQSLILKEDDGRLYTILLLCGFPAFLSGFAEDLYKNINPSIRMSASILTGIFFVYLTQFKITNINIYTFDLYVLSIPSIAFILTSLSIASLSQSFNIIDGLNGLSIGTALICMSAICFLSITHNDIELQKLTTYLLLPTIILFIYNFPKGKIFLGDGGAYLLGALLSFFVIILSENNNEISPFCSLLIILYPLYELFRSIFRRVFIYKNSILMPDNKHLHSSIFNFYRNFYKNPLKANYVSSTIILGLPLFCSIWAITFYNKTLFLIVGIFLFIIIYEVQESFFSKEINLKG